MTEVAAGIDVPATPATVWEVLTDVSAYPRWNTLLSVRGFEQMNVGLRRRATELQ